MSLFFSNFFYRYTYFQNFKFSENKKFYPTVLKVTQWWRFLSYTKQIGLFFNKKSLLQKHFGILLRKIFFLTINNKDMLTTMYKL